MNCHIRQPTTFHQIKRGRNAVYVSFGSSWFSVPTLWRGWPAVCATATVLLDWWKAEMSRGKKKKTGKLNKRKALLTDLLWKELLLRRITFQHSVRMLLAFTTILLAYLLWWRNPAVYQFLSRQNALLCSYCTWRRNFIWTFIFTLIKRSIYTWPFAQSSSPTIIFFKAAEKFTRMQLKSFQFLTIRFK